VITGQAVFTVDAPVGAVLQLAFATGQDLGSLRLRIDHQNDGTVDHELAPDSLVIGTAATDTVAPITTATVRATAPLQGSVTLSAVDEASGSGVAATYYLVGTSSTAQLYTVPLTLPVGTVVRFMSVDQAGNTEAIKEVRVDVPDPRQTAEPIVDGDHLRQFIDPQGDEDWFWFDADGRSRYRAELLGLPADYDLELYNEAGQLTMQASRRGKATEKIQGQLAAGRYYLRVVGYKGAWDPKHPYHLKLQTLDK
jgi:hypothetical protein